MESELINGLIKKVNDLQDKVDGMANGRVSQQDILPQAVKSRNIATDAVGTDQIQSGVTITNPTIVGATYNNPIINVGSDATGDIYYRNSSGIFTRRGIGSTNQVLTVSAGLPTWSSVIGSVTDEDTTGTSATSSSTYANITGADVAVTTTVVTNILLIGTVQAYANIDLAPYTITLYDGASVIGGSARIYLRSSNPRTTVTVHTIVAAKAAGGPYTYTLQHKSEDNTTTCTAETFSLLAIAIP